MAGYQFIHYEAYARKGNETKRSLIAIAQEADRAYGSHPHVTTPLLPKYLLGSSFIVAAKKIVAAADLSKVNHSGKKRKLRRDANVGIGLVASHPMSLNDLNSLSGKNRLQMINDIEDWANHVVTFADAEFPGLVQCAALHWDESHPHVHVLIGRIEPSDDFDIIHKGEKARKRAQGNDRTGKGKKLGNDAYTQEMRRFQDCFHSEVSIYYGQARLGPKRRRLSRSEWQKEQKQAESLTNAIRKALDVQSKIDNDISEAEDQAQIIFNATRDEASYYLKQAKIQQQTANGLMQKVRADARKAAELRLDTLKVKSILDERIKQLSKYDSLLGRLLGFFGIRQRIEQNATLKLRKQLSCLRKKIDTLSARVDRDKAIKKNHDHAVEALMAMHAALSVSIEDYPSLQENGALQRHFEYINTLIRKENSTEKIKDQINEYMHKLRMEDIEISSLTSRVIPEINNR